MKSRVAKIINKFCIIFLILFIASYGIAAPILSGTDIGSGWWTVGSSGEDRWASAEFNLSDTGILSITLTNWALHDNWVPNLGLAGIFFDYAIDGGLGVPIDVRASSIYPYPLPSTWTYDNDVSGEFGYLTDADVQTDGVYPKYFISSTSLDPEPGYVGSWDGIDASTLVNTSLAWDGGSFSPYTPDGKDFLILNTTNAGQAFDGVWWISNTVTINWELIDGQFNTDRISDVHFVYGTDYATPTPVPEPATMLLLGTGLIGIAGLSRRRFKNNKS